MPEAMHREASGIRYGCGKSRMPIAKFFRKAADHVAMQTGDYNGAVLQFPVPKRVWKLPEIRGTHILENLA